MDVKVNESNVIIGETEFVVKEPTVGEIMPLLPLLSSDDQEVLQNAQLDLMKLCVYFEGDRLGDGVAAIGVSTYLVLTEEVMKVTGLSGDADEGND